MKIASYRTFYPAPEDGESAVTVEMTTPCIIMSTDQNSVITKAVLPILSLRYGTEYVNIDYAQAWGKNGSKTNAMIADEQNNDTTINGALNSFEFFIYGSNVYFTDYTNYGTDVVYDDIITIFITGTLNGKTITATCTVPVIRQMQGSQGRILYPAGEYSADTRYSYTATTAPFVLEEGKYYYIQAAGSGTSKGLDPKTDYAARGNNAVWRLGDSMKFAFIEVLFANFAKLGSAIFYGNYSFSQYGINAAGAAVKTADGYKAFDSGNMDADGYPDDDASFRPNIFIDWLKGLFFARGAKITDAILNNVLISGSIRNPFVYVDDYAGSSDAMNRHDNIYYLSDDTNNTTSLLWNISQSGRVVTVVTHYGRERLTAPSGYYFYHDSVQSSYLDITNQVVQLMGLAVDGVFKGWLVINKRRYLGGEYGRPSYVVAYGRIVGTPNGYDSSQSWVRSFDQGRYTTGISGSGYTCTRVSEGHYRIFLPYIYTRSSKEMINSGNMFITVIGFGNVYVDGSVQADTPCKASLAPFATDQSLTTFDVYTSDNESLNDGGFYFKIENIDSMPQIK